MRGNNSEQYLLRGNFPKRYRRAPSMKFFGSDKFLTLGSFFLGQVIFQFWPIQAGGLEGRPGGYLLSIFVKYLKNPVLPYELIIDLKGRYKGGKDFL